MIQSGTNLADSLPRRVAWGIVIAVLLAIAIFALPNMNFESGAKRELDLADPNTYMQLLGMTKAEIQQKFGPPKSSDPVKNELIYDLPSSGDKSNAKTSWIRITFDKSDHCMNFVVKTSVQFR